uniref:Polymerase nucleotidyl transferase domain-containing protein n=1 Tax=Romanomermis culicivorax TaxID=13658 RepID=A0A915II88_ROMCU
RPFGSDYSFQLGRLNRFDLIDLLIKNSCFHQVRPWRFSRCIASCQFFLDEAAASGVFMDKFDSFILNNNVSISCQTIRKIAAFIAEVKQSMEDYFGHKISLEAYGSTITGLAVNQASDLDLSVDLIYTDSSSKNAKIETLRRVAAFFLAKRYNFKILGQIELRFRARVPLIKFTSEGIDGSEWEIEITVTNRHALQNSKLIKKYIEQCPIIKNFMVFLKHESTTNVFSKYLLVDSISPGINVKDVYASYSHYCMTGGHRILKMNAFGASIAKQKVLRYHSGNRSIYEGVRWKVPNQCELFGRNGCQCFLKSKPNTRNYQLKNEIIIKLDT